jgi:uncharacterized protein (TIGR02391 family)
LLSGLTTDGAELVSKAFSIQSPILVLGTLITESEKSEQKGFAKLLVGLFGAVRNPLAHAPKTTWPMSEQERPRHIDTGFTHSSQAGPRTEDGAQ